MLTAAIILMLILIALAATGSFVATTLGLVGVLGIYLFLGPKMAPIIGLVTWSSMNSFILSTIPIFIFMGEVFLNSGLSDRIYRNITPFFSRIPGSLFQSNIVSCALFSAICGSSAATAATIGTVAIPEMKKRGYDMNLLLGSILGGGTLGILIPPSITLIIYGAMVGESIGKLFMGGIIPGILLAAFYIVYLMVRVIMRPEMTPEQETYSASEMILSALELVPFCAIIFAVLGGIYFGFTTPTEAASVGAVSALLLAFVYRSLSWLKFKAIIEGTLRTSCMILFIVVGAQILSATIANLGIPRNLSIWVAALPLSREGILAVISLFYLCLGCFFDGISMMLLTLPVIFPTILALGFDPIWFGVVLTILIEAAQLTPPVGMNLFVIKGLNPDRPMRLIISAGIPFIVMQLLLVVLVTVFPNLILWLPSLMAVR